LVLVGLGPASICRAHGVPIWYLGRGPNIMAEELPKTLGVVEAGKRYFNLGRNSSYAAAKKGEIPTIRIGRRLRVPVPALEEMLKLPMKKTGAA
jgi:hypothetical protein